MGKGSEWKYVHEPECVTGMLVSECLHAQLCAYFFWHRLWAEGVS